MNRFPRKLSQPLGVKNVTYLPAGSCRHSKSQDIYLNYVLSLRPLLAAKNLLYAISVTVPTLSPKISLIFLRDHLNSRSG